MKRKNIFKSLLAAAMALIMIFGAAPLSGFVGISLPLFSMKAEAATETKTTEDGLFEYKVEKIWTEYGYTYRVRITRCNKKGPGKVVVPGTIKGLEVKWIDNGAFFGCTRITSIVIPDSVISIDRSAFSGCTNLAEITVSPDNKNYSSVDGVLFNKDGSELIVYPKGNGRSAYTVPDGVTSIGGSAFFGCTNLAEIVIPNSVISIDKYTFSGCINLTDITVSPDNKNYSSVDGVLFNKDGSKLIVYLKGNGRSAYTVPDGVTQISYSAFYDCTSLAEIVIPDSVTSIGGSAFSGCTSLAEIVIPDSVTSIGGSAFSGCTSLAEIDIPDSVTSIGSSAFEGCTSLSKVKLSNNLTIIEERTFYDCTSLAEIVIPDSVTAIGDSAFSGCTSLAEIVIPDSATEIGEYAFSCCTSLSKVQLSNNLTIIEESAFFDCTSLAEIVIPDSVTSIGRHAFSCCTSLSKVQLSNNLTIIEEGTFSGCRSLTEIVIPDSVTEIRGEWYEYDHHSSAFSGCTSLAKVKLSNNLTIIEAGTFRDCTSLTEILIPDSVTEIRGEWYNEHGVRHSSAFSGCTSLAKVKLSNNLTIIEAGTFSGCRSLTEIVIPDSVTEIRTESYYNDNGAFSGCTSLSKVKLSNNLAKIGGSAFYGCTSLAEIVIPDSVTSIGGSAFYGCTSLAEVKLSNNLTIIEAETFSGCTSLAEIVIPDSVTEIRGMCYSGYDGNYYGGAFSGCTSLAEITIPDSVTAIGGSAFSNCISLESITIGSGVERLDNEWIASCRRLESITVSPENKTYSSVDGVLFNKDKSELSAYPIGNKRSSYTIPDGVEKIGKKAFYGCRYIESLTIPVNVIEIDDSAFENCYSLKNVYYLGTRAQWKAVVIGTKNEALTRATVHCIDDPPCDHVWGEWEVVEEATYEKEGLERRACSLCDIEETRVIPKLVRASAIELSESEKTVFVGDTFTITATVKPEDAFNRTVTWSSSDPSIATVNENGTVTAIAKGEAIITAESADGVKAECKVTVEKKVAAIELSESEKTVFVGDTFTITATVKPEDAFNRTVTWSSSDPSIATVNENGTVTAIAKGEAIITAESADGVTAECKVTVEKKDGFFKTLLKIITAPFRAIINLFKKLFGK